MSVRRPTMRSSASLLAGLLIAATVSSGATAATPRAGSATAALGAGAPAAASPAVKKFDAHFVPRTVGRRAPNNVRRLAARKPTVRPVRSLPVLGRTTGAAPAPSGSGPKAALAAAPDPVDATTNSGDPAALTGFDGMSRSSHATNDGEPPDPWVAVGPEHVVQAVNLTMNITDRQGADPLSVALADFFLLPTDIPTFNADSARDLRQPPRPLGGDRGQLGLRYVVRGPLRHRLHRLRRLADRRSDRDLEPRLLLLAGPAPQRPGAGDLDRQGRDRQQPLQHDPGRDVARGGRLPHGRHPRPGRHRLHGLGRPDRRRGVRRGRASAREWHVQPARRRPGAGDERGAPAALRLRRRGRGHRSDLLHDRRDARRQHHRFRSLVGPDRRRRRGPMARSAPARPGRDRHDRLGRGRPPDRRALAGRPAGHRVDVSVRHRAARLRPGHRARDRRCHRYRPTHA